MTPLLIAAIALCLLSAFCFHLAENSSGNSFMEGLFGLICLTLAIGAAAAVIAFACLGYGWVASEHRAQIINREYGTNYTQAEVFYASDVIETVRELDRKRIDARVNVEDDQASATK